MYVKLVKSSGEYIHCHVTVAGLKLLESRVTTENPKIVLTIPMVTGMCDSFETSYSVSLSMDECTCSLIAKFRELLDGPTACSHNRIKEIAIILSKSCEGSLV